MKVLIASHNMGKVTEFKKILNNLGFEFMTLNDFHEVEEPEETGLTLNENSLIKAKYYFDLFKIPVIADDTGLFIEDLNGEPGIYTARYADDELLLDTKLPKYQCVIKLLRNLDGVKNRNAMFKCCVTCMMPDGTYFQEFGESNGVIAEEIIGKLNKPYLYSVFVLDNCDKAFSDLNSEELKNTYRHIALKKVLSKFNDGCR